MLPKNETFFIKIIKLIFLRSLLLKKLKLAISVNIPKCIQNLSEVPTLFSYPCNFPKFSSSERKQFLMKSPFDEDKKYNFKNTLAPMDFVLNWT